MESSQKRTLGPLSLPTEFK